MKIYIADWNWVVGIFLQPESKEDRQECAKIKDALKMFGCRSVTFKGISGFLIPLRFKPAALKNAKRGTIMP